MHFSRRGIVLGATALAGEAVAGTIPLLGSGGSAGGGGGGGFSPQAQAIFNAMTAQPDNTRKTLINDCVVSLINSGVWGLMDCIWVFAAHDNQAAFLQWKNPGVFFNAFGVNSPTFTTDRGIAGNGTTSYIDCGFAPIQGTEIEQNDATFGIWDRTETASAASVAGTGTVVDILINPRSSTSDFFTYRMNQTAASTEGSVPTAQGFSACSRTGATSTQSYKNGVQNGTDTVASNPKVGSNINCGRANNAFNTHEFAACVIGGGLTAQQHLDLYNALNAYMVGVGAA